MCVCDYRSPGLLNGIGDNGPEINQGVEHACGEIGAEGQGLMLG